MYNIKLINKKDALEMVQKYHYSNTLPKLNKYFLGFYIENKLVGVITLGWGTRPLHTIRKLFPSLTTKDYLEIGRMCMTDEMPRNSESKMLSELISWIKNNLPEIKVLFTWADGMLGKVGYVYQASNFLYAGYSITDIYMKDGVKIHPRQMKSLISPKDKRKGVRPTLEQLNKYNISHYKGKQYRYIFFTCSKTVKKKLLKECLVQLSRKYPKEDDLIWYKKTKEGKWEVCSVPPYKTDISQQTKNIVNLDKILI